MMKRLLGHSFLLTVAIVLSSGSPALAQDRMCDPGDEDCRAILINYIRNETVGIDVAFWFMEDARYTTELIRRHQAGVRIRVLVDPRANREYPLNASRLAELQAAGIPMRQRLGNYILHWKMMLFTGQNIVEFSGANYSANAWRPGTTVPYENYTDEGIIFSRDTSITNSFRTKFDDHWVDTGSWANYANITQPLRRSYNTYPKDPRLNFPPGENYRTRSIAAYKAERRKIDAVMFRITDRAHSDQMIAAVARGVTVRLITEPQQYRLPSRMWHSWNVDRMYMGGVKIKHRAHAGLNHQKSVILYDQSSATGSQSMVIFGSSNWTSPSAAGQVEHNMFATDSDLVKWYVDQFERKWNNLGGVVENKDFVPLPPDAPTKPVPATGSGNVATNLTLKWYGGPWAHFYDLYMDTNSAFSSPWVVTNLAETGAKTETSTFSYTLPTTALRPGTTYYWKVVGKTMAMKTKTSAVWSFTTAGGTAPPSGGAGDIVVYASRAPLKVGAWRAESDSTAAGGARMRHPNAGAAKVGTASVNPANYFEVTFNADAGRGYRLWLRGKADGNDWANDSVFVQFNKSVTSSGTARWRIGTTSATEVNLEACGGCGVSGWGWQDNGYGTNVLGPLVYFSASGPQTLRVQTREDGFAIDQIVLSPTAFVSKSPGALKNDTRILPRTQ